MIEKLKPLPDITKGLQVTVNNLKKMDKLEQLMNEMNKPPKFKEAKDAFKEFFKDPYRDKLNLAIDQLKFEEISPNNSDNQKLK